MILLVRHAWAGDRSEWAGEDRLRPLDERGRAQAGALVALLEEFELGRILSSPYLRCIETVEPLGEARGLPVEPRPELGEERQDEGVPTVIRELGEEPAAVCVHGGALEALGATGKHKKGAVWVIEHGRPVRYLSPPR